jgi:hypothetical protein
VTLSFVTHELGGSSSNVTDATLSFSEIPDPQDLIVVIGAFGVSRSASAPSGYTLVGSSSSAGDLNNYWEMVCWKKVADGTESAVTVDPSSSGPIGIHYLLYRPQGTLTLESDAAHVGEGTFDFRSDFDASGIGSPVELSFTAHSLANGGLSSVDLVNILAVIGAGTSTTNITDTTWDDGAFTERYSDELTFSVASNGLVDASARTYWWFGDMLNITDETTVDATPALSGDPTDTLEVFGRTFTIPYTDVTGGVEPGDINPHRYAQRRFAGTSLPFDLVNIRLGGEA